MPIANALSAGELSVVGGQTFTSLSQSRIMSSLQVTLAGWMGAEFAPVVSETQVNVIAIQ